MKLSRPEHMTPGVAVRYFGLSEYGLTREAIMIAYRYAVRAAHPDSNGTSGVTMAELQTARNVLLDVVSGRDMACKVCSGTGRVQGRIGVRRCDACAGTGDRR